MTSFGLRVFGHWPTRGRVGIGNGNGIGIVISVGDSVGARCARHKIFSKLAIKFKTNSQKRQRLAQKTIVVYIASALEIYGFDHEI